MTASLHYTKISLSKKELAHVYKQFADSVEAKIRHYLPGSSEHDPLQIQVQNMVTDHLAQVFEMAKHALVVDGEDLGDSGVAIRDVLALQPTEEVVPFDTELNQQLRTLIEAVERETTEVTRLRRELPQQARDAYEQLVGTMDQEVTSLVKEEKETEEEPGSEPDMLLEGRDAMAVDLSAALKDLNDLKRELPGHSSKIQTYTQTIDFLMASYERQMAEQAMR